MKRSCFLLALLLGFAATRATAITVSEGFDFANDTGSAVTFPLDLGVNTFSGSVSPFTDINDYFYVSVAAGRRITAASKTGPANAAGSVTFNGEILFTVPDNASFTSGYPLPAGTYLANATYGIGVSPGAWSVTIFVETLPDYTVFTTNDVIVVTDMKTNSDTLTVSEPVAGEILFTAGSRTFSVNGGFNITGNSGNLSLSSVSNIVVNAGGGTNTVNIGAFSGFNFPGLTINGGTGDDTVNFNGNITTRVRGNLDVNLQDDGGSPGVDTVNIAPGAVIKVGPVGTITVKCSRNVTLGAGSVLETWSNNLTVEANQQEPPTPGNFIGVSINGGTLKDGNTDVLSVKGRGGNDPGGAQIGVLVTGGGQILGHPDIHGKVVVNGTGGAGGGQVNRGVTVVGASSLIDSGEVTVIGQGGGIVASDFNIGVTVLSGGKINGKKVTVNGTGGLGGFFNQGVELGDAVITCGDSGITINGTPGTGTSVGFFMGTSASVTATNSNLKIYSDSMSWDNTSSLSAGSATVTLVTSSASTLIDLGGADVTSGSPKTLGLTDAELDRITAPYLVVAGASALTISSGISPAGIQHLTLSTSPASSIRATASGLDVTLPGTLNLGAPLAMPITGAAADTGYPQLKVSGDVNLTGSELNLTNTTFVGAAGNSFTIVNNAGPNAIIGTFTGLPEGGYLAWPGSPALAAQISYTGGDGNDVVLTLVPVEQALVVTTTADSGPGSLPVVVAHAAAAPGANTITFHPSLANQTIVLTTEITIYDTNGVTIDATSLAHGVTISGNHATRLFTVNSSSSLTLKGLTLNGGSSSQDGGAIVNYGALTLVQCTLSDNVGARYGGAILNDYPGILNMTNCTLYANSAAAAGAIANYSGTAILLHCMLAGNRATGANPGSHGGGAIDNHDSTLTLNACILAGNSSTITNAPDLWMETGTLSATNCLIGDSALSGINNGVNGNLVGSTLAPLDARLLPLGNYGGLTPTMPPRPDSPAIDAAPGSTVNIDQRGVGRPTNGDLTGAAVRDIGAVEFNNFLQVTTTVDKDSLLCGNGVLDPGESCDDGNLANGDGCDQNCGQAAGLSLREALRSATEGALIYFSPLVFTPSDHTVNLVLGELKPAKGVVISANGISSGVVINGNNSSRLFTIADSQVDITTATGTTATQSSEYGGFPAEYAIDGFDFDFTHTSGSEPTPSWTADFHRDVLMTRVEIVNRGDCCQERLRDITVVLLDANDAVLYTSPVLNPNNALLGPATLSAPLPSAMAVRKVKVQRDSSSAFDADRALSIAELKVFIPPTVTLQGLTLTGGNGAGSINTGAGGAIYNTGALTLNRCTLFANAAPYLGGAIYNDATLALMQCTLTGNSATQGGVNYGGGAIFNLGSLAVTHCTITTNSAASAAYGGGILNEGTNKLAYSIVAGNSVGGGGGGADYYNRSNLTYVGANILPAFANDGGTTTGPAPLTANPLLAPLGNFGGATMTMALQTGSPARNAATDSTITSDQRSFPIVSGVPDIGAYEAGSLWNYNAFAWEYFPADVSAVDHDRNGDYDGDGRVNGLEYAVFSDLMVSNSGPVLRFTRNAAGTVGTNVFSVFSVGKDLTYQLSRSTNLSSGWSVIYEFNVGIPQVTLFDPNLIQNNDIYTLRIADPSIAGKAQTFYRLQVFLAP